MSIQEQGRTRFIRALSAAIDIPESDIRLRIRAVSEAGLLQKHNEPFLPEHGIAILLSLMVSPTHAEAGRMVPRYAALPNAGVGDLDDRAILTKRQDEAVRRVLPEASSPARPLAVSWRCPARPGPGGGERPLFRSSTGCRLAAVRRCHACDRTGWRPSARFPVLLRAAAGSVDADADAQGRCQHTPARQGSG